MKNEFAERCGISYRQLDHWVRSGYLHPTGPKGTGNTRDWPNEELRVAQDMGRLVKAGLTLPLAHEVARHRKTEAILAVLAEISEQTGIRVG